MTPIWQVLIWSIPKKKKKKNEEDLKRDQKSASPAVASQQQTWTQAKANVLAAGRSQHYVTERQRSRGARCSAIAP